MPTTDEIRADGAGSADPSMSLVEIEPGVAVVFADRLPDGLDVMPFEMMAPQARRELTDRLAMASGLGNVAAQGLQGAVSAQGLVRLAPETLQALQTARPLTSGGWNLGVLVSDGGKFAAQVRWAPAVGVQAASFLTALGPAVALLALQIQLASISRRVDENIALTRDVLRAFHEDQWFTLLGLHETTMRAVEEARAAGVVNGHIFAALATRDADLRKQRHLFTSLVRTHVAALDADPKERRAYLQNNIEQICADAHGMLMAEGSWYRAQALRAGHIASDEANAVENAPLLAEIVESTRREHSAAMDDVERLLSALERQCRLIVDLPAERSLPFGNKRPDIRRGVAMAGALAERVAELRNRRHGEPDSPDPAVVVFKDGIPEDVVRILRWVVPGDKPVLAFADVNLNRIIGDNGYLGVTPDSVFFAPQGDLRRQGAIEREFPLADIRYVRFTEQGKGSPVLDVITKDENFTFTFDDWAHAGPGLQRARRLADILASAMNLPDDERRSDPLLSGHALESRATNNVTRTDAGLEDSLLRLS